MCQSMVDIQSPTAEIRRGKKKTEEDRRWKLQDENIMVCPITQGHHNKFHLAAVVQLLVDVETESTLYTDRQLCRGPEEILCL